MRLLFAAPAVVLAASLSACGGGGGGGTPTPTTQTLRVPALTTFGSGLLKSNGEQRNAPAFLGVYGGGGTLESRTFLTFPLATLAGRELVSARLVLVPDVVDGRPDLPPFGGLVAEPVVLGGGLDPTAFATTAVGSASPPAAQQGILTLDVTAAASAALSGARGALTLRVRLANTQTPPGTSAGYGLPVFDGTTYDAQTLEVVVR
jgi:hypothetical protein